MTKCDNYYELKNIFLLILLFFFVPRFLDFIQNMFDNIQTFEFGTKDVGLVTPESKEFKETVIQLVHDIIERTDKLVDTCKEEGYPNQPDADLLKQRWDKVKVRETSPNESNIAYVINKDKELRICLKDPVSKNAESLNTAMFVMIHELAHLMTRSYGHNQEFWTNNKLLLSKAIKLGLYQYRDYSSLSTSYCGLKINSSPCREQTCSI